MTDTPGDVAAKLEAFVENARAGIEFFDRIKYLPADERIAVGTDHWDWIEKIARRAADLSPAAASLLRDMSEREKALREALAEADELIAPMAACGAIVPDHAWDDDWYTLDSPESFDKAEMKFFASVLRRAVKFRRAAKVLEPK